MKFLILTLVALSVGFSESIEVPSDGPKTGFTPKEALKVFFKITEKDMSAKCDKVVDKTRWDNVIKALLSLQDVRQSMTTDIAKEAKKSKKVTDQVYDDLIKTRCMNNDALKKAKTTVIQAALPCVKPDKLAEILKYSISYSCKKTKQEAKEMNGSG